ncbi:MAG: hypothetical protein Q9167_003938 [Letrouitia subvulpina]
MSVAIQSSQSVPNPTRPIRQTGNPNQNAPASDGVPIRPEFHENAYGPEEASEGEAEHEELLASGAAAFQNQSLDPDFSRFYNHKTTIRAFRRLWQTPQSLQREWSNRNTNNPVVGSLVAMNNYIAQTASQKYPNDANEQEKKKLPVDEFLKFASAARLIMSAVKEGLTLEAQRKYNVTPTIASDFTTSQLPRWIVNMQVKGFPWVKYTQPELTDFIANASNEEIKSINDVTKTFFPPNFFKNGPQGYLEAAPAPSQSQLNTPYSAQGLQQTPSIEVISIPGQSQPQAIAAPALPQNSGNELVPMLGQSQPQALQQNSGSESVPGPGQSQPQAAPALQQNSGSESVPGPGQGQPEAVPALQQNSGNETDTVINADSTLEQGRVDEAHDPMEEDIDHQYHATPENWSGQGPQVIPAPFQSQQNDVADEAALMPPAPEKEGFSVAVHDDGRTFFGQVVCVMPIGRGTRVIVNEGTKQSPYFSIHPGAMFGAGVAREWLTSGKFDSIHTSVLDRKHIQAVVNFVDVEHTAKFPTRKQIRYFRVLVNNTYTWLSRSQLIRCLGPQALKSGRMEAVIGTQQDQASRRIEIHKERGINPDTGKELTNEELDKMPWFSEEARKKGAEDMEFVLDLPE